MSIKTKKIKYISDLITYEDINNWSKGDIITIKAGTGAGKSTFILNRLYDYAKKHDKKILLLVHRRNAKRHFQLKIDNQNKNEHIKVDTYQNIQNIEEDGWQQYNLDQYDYIVADESHYFISDAAFNKTTDISFNKIIKHNKSVKILMSATGDYIKKYINLNKKLKTIDYSLPINHDYIKSLTFYNNQDSIHYFINNFIKNNKKAVIFCNSAKRAYELHKHYKQYSFFNCSKDNKTYYRYVDQDKINKMLENERFDDLLLFTTITMDTAVSIHNHKSSGFKLNNIIIDGIKDVGVIKQCVGRKRLDPNDKDDHLNLIIRGISNQQLGGELTKTRKMLEHAKYFKENDSQLYSMKYGRNPDKTGIVYSLPTDDFDTDNVKYQLNELAYYKQVTYIKELKDMLSLGDWGYNRYLAREFGFDYRDCIVYEDNKEKQTLEEYLDSIVGKVMLQAKDRKKLIETINVRQDGKLLKGLDSLNKALEELNYNYRIKKFETSRIIDGKKKKFKSAWKVMKLVEK